MSQRKQLTDEQLGAIWKEMLKPDAKKPPRLDRSAWEPCSACKTEKIIIHVPAFKAMAVCNQHMDHGAFDLTLHLNFCPYCGRPLTDAAWEMLERRLAGRSGGGKVSFLADFDLHRWLEMETRYE